MKTEKKENRAYRTEVRPLGLYIHIPFCIRKCRYCDFLSAPAEDDVIGAYLESLCGQLKAFGKQLKTAYSVDSIFIGGGTPSLLSQSRMRKLLETVYSAFLVERDAEISVECNPGTVDRDKLAAYKSAGINRLSFGLQSADNGELKLLGRIHTWEDYLDAYRLARDTGFDNINTDLMLGLPGQSAGSCISVIKKVIALQPEHISAYSLIIEEGTEFYRLYGDGSALPSEDESVKIDEAVWKLLKEGGYRHYEISNYARPGRECMHNLKYWHCEEYLGAGTGAASCMSADCGLDFLREDVSGSQKAAKISHEDTVHAGLGAVRFKIINSTLDFIRKDWKNESDVRSSVCGITRESVQDEMEEMAFLGLRMDKGVDLAEFRRRFGTEFENIYGSIVRKYEKMGMMRVDGYHVALTLKGMEVANVIMSDFILDRKSF